jgi:hypothetical protein
VKNEKNNFENENERYKIVDADGDTEITVRELIDKYL